MDAVIIYRVKAILTEMGLRYPISAIDDFDPNFCIKDFGPHRLYEFRFEIRDDVDTTDFAVDFCAAMDAYNKISTIKADFYEINEYPGLVQNCHTVYLTVTTI